MIIDQVNRSNESSILVYLNISEFRMTHWNYTIYRSTLNVPNRSLCISAFDVDSGSSDGITYYIGTLSVPYFIINRTTGEISCRTDPSNTCGFNSTRFPITFDVYVQDNGVPPLVSQNNATVTIYYSDSNYTSPARWLDTSCEALNLSITERYYNMYSNQAISGTDFNGSIFYEITSSTPTTMVITSPFLSMEDLPFYTKLLGNTGTIFSNGIYVNK